MKRFFLGFALVSLVLAGAVSYLADASPDGLDYVTEQHGIAAHARDHPLGAGPLADYAVARDLGSPGSRACSAWWRRSCSRAACSGCCASDRTNPDERRTRERCAAPTG